MQATWIKLRNGSYGVQVTGFATVPQPHMRVVVTRRDGTESVETIARVLWADHATAICTIGKREPRRPELIAAADRMARGEIVRDPGEDAADRWNETHGDRPGLLALAERFGG